MIYICYLPFRGELGWYLISHVRRFHSDPYHKKIACIKPGHEALFPTADKFFYRWQDIPDNQKAGVANLLEEEEKDKARVIADLGNDVVFVSSTDITWDNKHAWSSYKFPIQPYRPHDAFLTTTDVVLCPRKREIDAYRNWTQDKWQYVLDTLTNNYKLKVGICGDKDTTYHLPNAWVYSYIEGLGVDKDIAMMLNTKLVVGQESGLQYLAHLCQKPFFCIDYSHPESKYYHNEGVPFKHWNPGPAGECGKVWHDPDLLIQEIMTFLRPI